MLVTCVLAAMLLAAPRARAFGVNIDAHEEACFQEVVKAGTKLGLTFQVAEGGFLDIDVQVRRLRSTCQVTQELI